MAAGLLFIWSGEGMEEESIVEPKTKERGSIAVPIKFTPPFKEGNEEPARANAGLSAEEPVGKELKEILKDRGSRYGPFEQQARVSVDLQWLLKQAIGYRAMPAYMIEALNMICVKMSRIVVGDPLYADSWKDIAGYATLVVEILEKEERENQNR